MKMRVAEDQTVGKVDRIKLNLLAYRLRSL